MTPDKKWYYIEPDENMNVVMICKTEQEIINEYYEFWKTQMEKVNKVDLINFDNCIEDWVVVNWASDKPFENQDI